MALKTELAVKAGLRIEDIRAYAIRDFVTMGGNSKNSWFRSLPGAKKFALGTVPNILMNGYTTVATAYTPSQDMAVTFNGYSQELWICDSRFLTPQDKQTYLKNTYIVYEKA